MFFAEFSAAYTDLGRKVAVGENKDGAPSCRGQALRQAAVNARRSDCFIGAARRARLAHMDTVKVINATAHQLARLIYAMLTKGQAYVDQGIETFEADRRDRQRRALQRKAAQFGLVLSEAASRVTP